MHYISYIVQFYLLLYALFHLLLSVSCIVYLCLFICAFVRHLVVFICVSAALSGTLALLCVHFVVCMALVFSSLLPPYFLSPFDMCLAALHASLSLFLEASVASLGRHWHLVVVSLFPAWRLCLHATLQALLALFFCSHGAMPSFYLVCVSLYYHLPVLHIHAGGLHAAFVHFIHMPLMPLWRYDMPHTA